MRCLIKYRIRRSAMSRVNYAIKTGKITKPDICSRCGKHGKRIDGHHENYQKPLKVVWLCTKCHGIATKDKIDWPVKIDIVPKHIQRLDESWESNKIEPDPIDSIYDNMIFEEYRHQLSLEPTILGEKII